MASTSPTAGLVVAGDGDFGANGLFGMGGASRVFLFPLGGVLEVLEVWWTPWRRGGCRK